MELVSETKFCVDCKYVRYVNNKPVCASKAQTEFNLIDGKYVELNLFSLPAFRIDTCKKEALFYEPKNVD